MLKLYNIVTKATHNLLNIHKPILNTILKIINFIKFINSGRLARVESGINCCKRPLRHHPLLIKKKFLFEHVKLTITHDPLSLYI